jgi:hypothetical protein
MTDTYIQPSPAGQESQLSSRSDGLRRKSRLVWAAALGSLFVHCALLLVFFGGPRALVSDQPLIHDDHGWHFYYSILGSRFLIEHGTTWGYDPFLMAGYPTDFFDTSDRFIKVAMIPMRMLSLETGYKISVFLMAAVVPLLFFAAPLWLGMNHRVAIIATILGTWEWWMGGGLSIFATGMVGFGLASIYGLALAGLFARYLQTGSRGLHIMLIVATPIALLVHPGIVLIMGAPCGVLYLINFKKLSIRRHLFIVLVCAFAIASNLFWIIPYFENLAFAKLPHAHFQDPLQIIGFLLFSVINRYQVIVPVLLVAAVAGFMALRREGRPDQVLCLGIPALIFLAVFFFGGLIPLFRDIEPGRYLFPLLFLLVFPAAKGFESWAQIIKSTGSGRFRRIAAGSIFAISIPSFLIFLLTSFFSPPEQPFVGMNTRVSSIRDWIIANTDRSARVLIEDRGPFNNIYEDTFATCPLAYYTSRELIGGPHWAAHLKHHFADLSGFELFGRFLYQWDETSLAEYMDLYNIGWVGAFSPLVRKLFEEHPALFKPVGVAGDFQFYEVKRERTFFIEGSGLVEADYNRLAIKNINASAERVVISYHWHPRLWTKPPAKVVRVMIGNDPVGFIGIINPRPGMIVETRYWRRN